MRKDREIIYAYAKKNHFIWDQIYSDITKKVDIPDDEYEVLLKDAGNYITLLDANYPRRLKTGCKRMPFVLNYEGDIDVLKEVDAYENKFIFLFEGDNSLNIPEDRVVTIHDGVIDIAGKLKLWLNKSERDLCSLHCFIPGFCEKILFSKPVKYYEMANKDVTKGKLAEITVVHCLDGGVDIYAKPTEYRSFNNKIIKQGAFLAEDASDVLEDNVEVSNDEQK